MSSTKFTSDDVRWTARRKAKIIVALDEGTMTLDGVCAVYGLSKEEIDSWRRLYTHGLKGLRTTRLHTYRPSSFTPRK